MLINACDILIQICCKLLALTISMRSLYVWIRLKKKKKDVSRYQPLYSAWICQTINKLQAETLTETTTLILARNKYTLPIKQHDLTGPQ